MEKRCHWRIHSNVIANKVVKGKVSIDAIESGVPEMKHLFQFIIFEAQCFLSQEKVANRHVLVLHL